ncbi:MAG: HAMP domain-containing histidine kinase, partial [Candidatus Magnetomorum sp.]|nr:HAMP domain-containing histidine kinase [Candidatus Magnetomorum sp.]
NLLEWARLQRGTYTFESNTFDLYDTAIETVSLFEDMANQKTILLTNDIQPNTIVVSDSRMLKTILRNFVNNAIKYTREKGRVHISSAVKDEYHIISVKDDGIGISPGDLEKLFCIDQTFSAPGTYQESGTGLGLILCGELSNKMGATIWAESEPDKGSTFYISVPWVESQS